VRIYLPVKVVLVFALWWNGTNFLRTTKKPLCLFQEFRETWGSIARKQIEDEEYGAVGTKKGEAETENFDDMHE